MRIYIAKLIIQIIIVWMSTIIASKCMDNYRKIKIYKDLADRNYKFNYEKLLDENNNPYNELNDNEYKTIFDKLLGMYPKVPFLNLFQSIADAQNYITYIEEVIQIFKQKDIIEKMTEREIKEYAKNKTGKNAKKITEDTYMRILNANELYFEDMDSNFIYEVNEELNDIIILKVTGKASYLTEEEQKNIVMDFWQEAVIGIMNSFGTLENFREYTEENKGVEINITNLSNEENKRKQDEEKTKIAPINHSETNTKQKTLSKKKKK